MKDAGFYGAGPFKQLMKKPEGILSLGVKMGEGMLDQKLTHEEVLETAEIVRKPFARLIALAIESIQENQ